MINLNFNYKGKIISYEFDSENITISDLKNKIEKELKIPKHIIVLKNENGEVIETLKRTNLPNLDTIPYPAWDLFDVGNIYCRYS